MGADKPDVYHLLHKEDLRHQPVIIAFYVEHITFIPHIIHTVESVFNLLNIPPRCCFCRPVPDFKGRPGIGVFFPLFNNCAMRDNPHRCSCIHYKYKSNPCLPYFKTKIQHMYFLSCKPRYQRTFCRFYGACSLDMDDSLAEVIVLLDRSLSQYEI